MTNAQNLQLLRILIDRIKDKIRIPNDSYNANTGSIGCAIVVWEARHASDR